jgi:peptidoglycan/xylan/chitin deacetylase (PgdA/CDA1 family)
VEVSVVIPARDAAATLGETLESLSAQTFQGWEAIVVDDGSVDATPRIAAEAAAHDGRIRLARHAGRGVGAARNAGIGLARGGLLLFLDADDLLHPHHLARLTAALEGGEGAALCGWRLAVPDGRLGPARSCPEGRGLFELLATHCAFAIHSCLVRRELVEEVGGFDPGLATCEDWDLWQRIARTGARFARVPESLAVYRMRPGSASLSPDRLLADGLRVIERGHRPDPRVAQPAPAWAGGCDRRGLPSASFLFSCWAAGLALGRGQDARPLLAALAGRREPGLDPEAAARSLFQAAALPTARLPEEWIDLWAGIEEPLDGFLADLESLSGSTGLARQARRALERMTAEEAAAPRPFTVGGTRAVRLEITEPVPGLAAPAGVERLRIAVTAAGEPLGTVELPVFGGTVPAAVLADAMADRFAWEILRRFLSRRAVEGFGWDVFLQELWGRPGWPMATFYDPQAVHEEAPARDVTDGWIEIEAAADLPELRLPGPADALLRIGGAAAGRVPLPYDPQNPLLGAHALRAALTQAGGYEMCRLAVREALLGQPFDAPGSLRERLAAAARREPAARCGTAFGRPPQAPIGSGPCRRACLPAAALPELLDLAAAVGQPVAAGADGAGCVTYDPELIPPAWNQDPRGASLPAPEAAVYGRSHFETLFASGPDPWRYTSPYEETKYGQTLDLLPPGPVGRALELACAEGHFTVRLAPRTGHLAAADVSTIALERARRRCAALPNLENVEFLPLDLTRDPLPGGQELIVCSEVLYYVGGRDALRAVAGRLAAALAPGGHLLTAHACLVADDADRPGFDWPHPFGARVIGETLAAAGELRLVRELRTPLYRIQLFRRDPSAGSPSDPPEIRETASLPPLPPEVAAHVLWQGGRPRTAPPGPVTTGRLPILMYHRIAPEGAAATRRWRLSPEAFEEQLCYLRDAGFHTPALEDWRRATEAKEPLPGRAVLLTFDDGTRDFAEHAWPLLQRYGFSALAFLVADHVGGTNRWDAAYGEEIPLLGWDEIRRLHGEGAGVGSHAATHRPLTSLPLSEAVREAARSRAVLSRGLGAPVDAIAYPHGAVDPALRHLAGACGYVYGLSCRPGRAALDDPLLDLPRIEVQGTAGFDAFVRSLGDA